MLIGLSETTGPYNTFFSDYVDDKGNVRIPPPSLISGHHY